MRKCALIILDGWGMGDEAPYNAIYTAKTPFFDSIWAGYPHTKLEASGEFVGLPKGQIGGSEVGHLTIGAGRIMFQSLPKITRAFEQLNSDNGLLSDPSFIHLLALAKQAPIHLVGLVSDGGVHSHIEHLFSVLDVLQKEGAQSPYLHVITDGRDTPPQAGMSYVEKLLDFVSKRNFGKLVTLSGRFYAMDRDQNWDRTDRAVQAIVAGDAERKIDDSLHGEHEKHAIIHALQKSYDEGVTDEFVEPIVLDHCYDGIRFGEAVFFFNFRSDRMKQLVTQIASKVGDDRIVTMMRYDKSYPYTFLFDKDKLTNTFGEYISGLGLAQLRAAETEKAPHITYFFNGGVEVTFDGEVRSIAESNKVTHDQKPEMKAVEIEEHVATYVKEHQPAFVLVNFANPDMVGHTGVYSAVTHGVETVDGQLKKLCETLRAEGYVCLVTADHGNADIMYDPETNEPHTAHTLNPVPFVVYDEQLKHLQLDQANNNGLDRIAATVCEVMELSVPSEFSPSLIISS